MAGSRDVQLHQHQLLSMHSKHKWQNWRLVPCILHFTESVTSTGSKTEKALQV